MAAVRFLTAGCLLYLWVRVRGAPAPTRAHWINASWIGALLVLAGNGLVVWAEQWVPSGLTALLVGMLPIWMVLADWTWGAGRRPGVLLIAGLLWGLFGVALLASSSGFGSGTRMGLIGGFAVMLAGICWAIGSIWSKRVALPAAKSVVSAMQMMWGGFWLLVTAGLTGELSRIGTVHPSAASMAALAYLIVLGSLVAFSAYVWLLGATTPALLTTYAYVNPVVALLLGWWLADEALTRRTLVSAFVILSAVVLITQEKRA